ncbi:putative phosphinothricin acetyltransferase protein [Fimicolochytrium jonesii]|uniref:putative phosphinothricin acetyltransferase protein n=1 Tax=Fimicolochytrium jonesii TaxID=1396493 RepID=UPI0022FEA938|nr:putative phosphinothricin acetyltransferase protein [Fimicolochytrium jonesii]KAI8819834.1 putative phosphinothricin acetyltransferase protein [Fimicolochytrium jonesii]
MAASTYVFRDGTLDDVPALLEIYNYEVKNGNATLDHETPTLEHRRGWFSTNFGEKYPILVAVNEVDGNVRGYDRTCEITLYIHHEHQGQGLGKRLIEALLTRAAELDYTSVIAIIGGENDRSLQLFKSLGFDEVGRFPGIGFKFGVVESCLTCIVSKTSSSIVITRFLI